MPRQLTRGFSLIECMVTLIVLSLGLLGISKMVNNSVVFTDEAYMRTQSVVLAYELADKIRANLDNADSYAIGVGETIQSPPDCSGQSCSGGQLALADLAGWKTRVGSELPLGDGSAVVTADDATITIQWNDRGEQRSFSVEVAL